MPRQTRVDPAVGTQLKPGHGGPVFASVPLPERLADYPELRYMGSKHRLLPWIHGVLRALPFETAADPFVGSGCVAYLLKSMGKGVVASDFLRSSAKTYPDRVSSSCSSRKQMTQTARVFHAS
jgi:adenine-specific DNA-methyltransferase